MKLQHLLLVCLISAASRAAELRLGMIGLDTSHATDFTHLINDAANPHHVPGARVVAAVKASSPDIESSYGRVDAYTRELTEKWGVTLMGSVEELCAAVDAVLIESVDGRPHLAQARPVFQARKPLFIDKPLAGSLKDAVEIYKLAKATQTPCFTSSAYRFYDSMAELKKSDVGRVRGALSYGPGPKEQHHPDLFWYAVHPSEALFTVLGRGCRSVTRVSAQDADVITGLWTEDRTGVLVALRTKATPHQVTLFGEKAVAQQKPGGDSYAPLVREIIKFFQTGLAPVSLEESIELFAFMEAADESKRRGGTPVSIHEVLKKNGWEEK
ncbi:MAG: Gfo/Idh/MocA family protein [Verrucomicrobiales bacterium]